MKSTLMSVEVSFLIHATEDSAKVIRSVSSVLELEEEPTVETMEGHFGNKIERVSFHVIGQRADNLFRKLFDKIDEKEKSKLLSSLENYIDEHKSLFIRLDKQNIIGGKIVFSQSDSVRIKVKPRLYILKGNVYDFYRRMIYLEKR